ELAAVLGRENPEDLLWEVASRRGMHKTEPMDELLLRHVLEEERPGWLRFSHDTIRELCYARVELARRPQLHRAAAEGLNAFLGPERDERLAELGHHWEQAGERIQAQACYGTAAQKAVSRYAHGEAERLFRAA